jgi:hypothetical protein
MPGQPFPSYNSEKHKGKVAVNDDGSVDLYMGPKAPPGKEPNWLQTVPNKGGSPSCVSIVLPSLGSTRLGDRVK